MKRSNAHEVTVRAVLGMLFMYYSRQPYHPAVQDRLPTEAKQG